MKKHRLVALLLTVALLIQFTPLALLARLGLSPPVAALGGKLTLPSGSATLPSSSLTMPSSSVTLPSGSVTLPSSSLTLPSSSVTLPSGSVTLPSSSVTLPSSSLTLPSSSMSQSSASSSQTSTNVTQPSSSSTESMDNQTQVIYWEGTVLPDHAFVLSFNSPVDVLTVTTAHIKVFNATGAEMSILLQTSLDALSVAVQPQNYYPAGEYILKTLDGVKDPQGHTAQPLIELHFTVAGEAVPDAIEISPAQVSLQPGQQAKFTVGFIGGSSSQSVTWLVSGGDGSDAFIGSISADGTYQAPMKPGLYLVEASSIEYPDLHDESAVVVEVPPAAAIDLALDAASLDIPGNATPGTLLTLHAIVKNLSATGQRPGGGTVRFIFNDRIINEVPFYLKAGEASQDVRAWYYLPEGEYAAMVRGDVIQATVTAVIDPYDQITETNETNNSASGTISVQYGNDISIEDTEPLMAVDATGLSVWSVKDDAPGDRLYAAQPGQKLNLKARIDYVSPKSSEDINIKFLVDGVVVFNDNRRVYRPSSGFFEVTSAYQVPFHATEPLDFRVLLSNGESAGLRVQILPYDVGIRSGDLYWSSAVVATPGQNLYPHALLKNLTSIISPYDDARIAWRALIDGQEYAEGDYRLYYNELNVVLPPYLVPQGRTEPILLTVVTDVYDQLSESDETNNIASIRIPVVNNGTDTPNFFIRPEDLLYIANPIVPGATVSLYANVHSQGAAYPNQDLKVRFLVNGDEIITKSVERLRINPLQAEEVTHVWTVPADLPPGKAVLQVMIDPGNEFAESNETDNLATLEMDIAKSDLDVSDTRIRWDPDPPATGATVRLKATVRNNGMGPANNVKVRFYANGQSIGDATITQIRGASAAYAILDWVIPAVPPANLPYNTLEGHSQKMTVPSTATKSYQITVGADPDPIPDPDSDLDGVIPELNEDNNTSDAVTLKAVIPDLHKFIFIHVSDVLGSVPSASVKMTAANGESATVDTNDDGWCSFSGVPVGSYTLAFSKEYYHPQNGVGQFTVNDAARTREFFLERTADFAGLTGPDKDNDLIADADEPFYRTDPNNPDSDGDGVIDGKDLSPLTNPANPVPIYLQKPGMIRYDQVVGLHGLDGWTEVWDMEFSFSTGRDEARLMYTTQTEGTRASTMDDENYRTAIDNTYDVAHFKAYKLENISAEDVGTKTAATFPEKTKDDKADDHYNFDMNHTHRTGYKFYYDYLIDYQKVSLKNSAEILYPTESVFFSYLLIPVKTVPGKAHTFSFQFIQNDLTQNIFYQDDSYYTELGLQYTFYESDNFDDDHKVPDAARIVFAENDGSDLFSFSLTLTPEQAALSQYYLKITPIWVNKHNGETSLSPAEINWNLTGLSREVVFYKGSDGRSNSVTEMLTTVDGLNTNVTTYEEGMALTASPNSRVRVTKGHSLTMDPNASADNRFQYIEITLQDFAVIGSALGVMKNALYLSNCTAVVRYNAATMEGLPKDCVFLSPAFKGVTSSVALGLSVVSLFSNGLQIWKSFQKDDKILCAYYVLKTGAAAGQTANTYASICVNVTATASKTGFMAKLGSKGVGTGISIAIGVIEVGYYATKYLLTDDPIQKTACEEKISAAVIDTTMSYYAATYPPILAFQATWLAVHEIYGFFWGQDKMAYILTTSPGTAYTFLKEYWSDRIPSQFSEKAYGNIVAVLFERFRIINLNGYPFVPVFVDPLQ